MKIRVVVSFGVLKWISDHTDMFILLISFRFLLIQNREVKCSRLSQFSFLYNEARDVTRETYSQSSTGFCMS